MIKSTNYIPQDFSIIISSDTTQGATQKSANGDRFQVQLGDPIAIPANAKNVNIDVEEAVVWWSSPNIISGVNDKIYLNGTQAPVISDKNHIGYDPLNTYSVAVNTVQILKGSGANLPIGEWSIGNWFIPQSGAIAGQRYHITGITTDTTTQLDLVVDNPSDTQSASTDNFEREVDGASGTAFTLTIPEGLYDLNSLNSTISRLMENAGGLQMISLSADFPTQRVIITFNQDDVTLDFTQSDTFRSILGFNSSLLGPYSTVPYNVLADNTATFNSIDYFLIHTDLISKGIRFNNAYNQVISQVLIDVSPGSQIVSRPNNPARVNADELSGSIRNKFEMWITDQANNSVNMNGENWSCRLLISYLIPI